MGTQKTKRQQKQLGAPRPPTSRAQLCQTVAACAMNGSTYLGSLLALFGTHVLVLFTNFSGPPAFTQCSVTTISLNHQQTNYTANTYQSAILSSSCKTSLSISCYLFSKSILNFVFEVWQFIFIDSMSNVYGHKCLLGQNYYQCQEYQVLKRVFDVPQN